VEKWETWISISDHYVHTTQCVLSVGETAVSPFMRGLVVWDGLPPGASLAYCALWSRQNDKYMV